MLFQLGLVSTSISHQSFQSTLRLPWCVCLYLRSLFVSYCGTFHIPWPSLQNHLPHNSRFYALSWPCREKTFSNIVYDLLRWKIVPSKRVITSLPIFSLCALELPPKILEPLVKIRRRSLCKKTEQGGNCNSLAAGYGLSL